MTPDDDLTVCPGCGRDARRPPRPGGDCDTPAGHDRIGAVLARLAAAEAARDAALAATADWRERMVHAEVAIAMRESDACAEKAEAERDAALVALATVTTALRRALAVWCERDPGGDGADGETYALCTRVLASTAEAATAGARLLAEAEERARAAGYEAGVMGEREHTTRALADADVQRARAETAEAERRRAR